MSFGGLADSSLSKAAFEHDLTQIYVLRFPFSRARAKLCRRLDRAARSEIGNCDMGPRR